MASRTSLARQPRLSDFATAELNTNAAHHVFLAQRHIQGARRLGVEIDNQEKLWQRDATRALTADEREATFVLFEQVLAYVVALDTLHRFHADFWRLDAKTEPASHARHFVLALSTFSAELRLGLAFVSHTLNSDQFEKLLDEGSPEHGLPPGAYRQLKWHLVHAESLTRWLAMRQYLDVLAKNRDAKLQQITEVQPLLALANEDSVLIQRQLLRQGTTLFAGNAFDLLRDQAHSSWFPVQAQIAELMGDIKVRRLDTMLVSAQQARAAVPRSQPGDIIVERRNWYLSNVALPGFWPHAALWLGSQDELARFLDSDAEVRAAYPSPFTQTLAARFPQAWHDYTSGDDQGHERRVIEAMSEGIVFTSAEHSLRADYVAAMRPRLSKLEIAQAIERAFSYAGRPYDFDFDFYTDTSLVCSELIYKAYEPRGTSKGLQLPLERIAGRMTLGPNRIVRMFDEQYGQTNQQLDFVWFLDGREHLLDAVWADATTLRASHQRPKWDVVQH